MDLNLAKQALETGIKFVQNSGLKVVELRRGYVKCLMPFAGNGNHIGTMYAGSLFTVAEIPGGALFLSSFDTARYVPIIKEMTMRFQKPAKGDVTIEVSLDDAKISAISADADANGKAEFVLEGQIKTADGTVVASSHGVYQLRSTQWVPKN